MSPKHLHSKIDDIINNLGIDTTNYWINLLKTIPAHEVGIIKASGKLISEPNLSQLCNEMSFLGEQEFYLPLVIGGGVLYDKLPSYKNAGKINGLRISKKELMNEIVPLAKANQEEVVNCLKKSGVDAVSIPFDSIIVEPHGVEIDKDGKCVETHYVGDVVNVDTKPIIEAIYHRKIPVISHIGVYNGEFYNTNAMDVATEVAKFCGSKKMIILGDMPIYDKEGKLIKKINSEHEYHLLKRNGTISAGMITNCDGAFELLDYLGPGHCVQITALKEGNEGIASTGLLEEILGNGSGTKLTVPPIISTYPFNFVDYSVLESMINDAFSSQYKVLKKSYPEMIASKDPVVYLDAQKKGGAISYPIDVDGKRVEYLCKLFTLRDYEGMGIASGIINTIILQKGNVAFRTDLKNEETIKYYRGILEDYPNNFVDTNHNYMVFGINIPSELKKKTIEVVANIPKSFVCIK